ncbi:YitT family protein [Bacillus gobiensis]|uniref:YitT family protein n=1 Tax=Bacillus gobiensis TaxID=1441095 RepID=UPI003D1CDA31
MKNIIYIVIGTFLFAISVTLLAMPNHIAEGGIVGLSLLIYFGLGISPSISNLVIFIILLAVGIKFLPRHMIYKTLLNVPLLSLFIYLTENLGKPMEDPLLAAIFAGLLTGVGFGLIYQAGSSVGGTSIIALMLKVRLGWNLTGTGFALDALVVLAGIFIIGPVYTMYTLIALFIGKLATDYVLGGFDSKKAVNIISPKIQEISHRVMNEMSSSATMFEGHGEYTKEKRSVLYVVVRSHRLLHLKRLIKEIDPNAFVVVHNVKDVSGGTFFATHHSYYGPESTTVPQNKGNNI